MPDVLNKVISLFSGDGEGGSDKDILLRQVAKEISQNKYAKFYRVKQGEIDPAFAQYMFSVYRSIYPLQIFLKDPLRETRIRQVTLESFLDKQVMDLIKRLSPEGIAERQKSAGADFLKELQANLTALAAGFDTPKIAAADKCYNLIASVKQFALFDYCSLLRKFDSEVKEGDFLSQPKFTAVDASVVAPDIASLVSVIPVADGTEDWKTAFEILKYCKGGAEVIPLSNWTGLLSSLKDLKHSKILEMMGKLATGNPIWDIKPVIPNEALSALWLEQKNRDVRDIIGRIAGSQKSAQINALVNAVFGTPTVTRLLFYTSEKGRVYLDKELGGFIYAPALNHLHAFIQDFLTREVHDLCDILLVRGQWTNNAASRQMSENYHAVMEIPNEIIKLDETLDEDGSNGPRLRGALLRVDRDKSQARYINAIINSINEEALYMINEAVPALIVVGKHFKMLVDDYEKKYHELIMNWKELTQYSKVPISQRISFIYKKINYFVQLMLLETRSDDE